MEIIGTLFEMDAAKTQSQMERAQEGLVAEGERLKGKQDELGIREQMMEASASITAAAAGSGITAGSGTIIGAQMQAKRRGMREIITSRSETRSRIMESQMRGAQARMRGRAKITKGGIKLASQVQGRVSGMGGMGGMGGTTGSARTASADYYRRG